MPAFVRETVLTVPNFLIIGAMKAGTTSLYHYLKGHPDVFMPAVKELDFFVEGINWRRGLPWYRRQFASSPSGAKAVGEASTNYSKYPIHARVAEKVALHLPEVRLIYVLRDPVERIRSHYQHVVATGREHRPLAEAVLEDPRYVTCSRYALQIDQYMELFDRQRMLIITAEQLRIHRADTVRRVLAFLGVDASYDLPALHHEYLKTAGRPRYPRAMGAARRLIKNRFPNAKKGKEFVDAVRQRRARAAFQQEREHEWAASNWTMGAMSVPDEIRRRVEDLLRDDVARLYSYMPANFDGWGIA